MATPDRTGTRQDRPERRPLGEPEVGDITEPKGQPSTHQQPALSRASRPRRIPVGQGDRLKFSQREGYYRRVVNDVGDRIQRFLDAGYEFVYGNETGSQQQGASDPTKMSSRVSKHVGGGVMAYLMEQPIEYRKEDMAAKDRRVDESEAAMRKSAVNAVGRYGKVNINDQVEETRPA